MYSYVTEVQFLPAGQAYTVDIDKVHTFFGSGIDSRPDIPIPYFTVLMISSDESCSIRHWTDVPPGAVFGSVLRPSSRGRLWFGFTTIYNTLFVLIQILRLVLTARLN